MVNYAAPKHKAQHSSPIQQAKEAEEFLRAQENSPAFLSPTPHNVLQLQRLIGNQATMQFLNRASAPKIQRAGDPMGLMIEHEHGYNINQGGKIDMTNHHIIPENKLHTLWENLNANGHVSSVKAGLMSVARRGFNQLREVAKPNLIRYLREVVDDLESQWNTDQVLDGILNDLFNGVTARTVITTHLNSASSFQKTELEKKLPKLTKAATGTSGTTYTKDQITTAGDTNSLTDDHYSVISQMLMWMPGNIHVGPKKRLLATAENGDPDVDDGGDEFEEAAKQVISAKQFSALRALNDIVDEYNESGDESLLKKLRRCLEQMAQFSVTPYDPVNWRYDKTLQHFRLKKKI